MQPLAIATNWPVHSVRVCCAESDAAMTYEKCKAAEIEVLGQLANRHGYDLTLTDDNCVVDGILAKDGHVYVVEIKTRPSMSGNMTSWLDQRTGQTYDSALFDVHKVNDVQAKARALGATPIVAQYLPSVGKLYWWNLDTTQPMETRSVSSQASMDGGTKKINRHFFKINDAKVGEMKL
tara:strand:+ start:2132 stop:2668 length:537 start_codon:yes stop_codon:yes gene_type:complete